MLKRLTTTLAAAALAFTTTAATPARAGDDDVVRFILGAAALGLILNSVNTAQAAPQAHRKAPPPRYAPPPRHVPPARYAPPPARYTPPPAPPRHADRSQRAVPASCLFDLPGHYGPRPVVGARCVDRWNRRADLPQACAFDIRPGQGERRVYGLTCLRDRGYRLVRG